MFVNNVDGGKARGVGALYQAGPGHVQVPAKGSSAVKATTP